MNFPTIILISLGLAMDAFAVSIASGVIIHRQKLRKSLIFGCLFGFFQMIMPVIGWATGRAFYSLISNIDHWIAFGLLSFIGVKMIWEAVKMDDIENTPSDLTAVVLLGLAVATSIDALAVGLGFACLNVSIIFPVIMIGIVTFILSTLGVLIGARVGHFLEKKVEIVGGIILILIGIKILIEHLCF